MTGISGTTDNFLPLSDHSSNSRGHLSDGVSALNAQLTGQRPRSLSAPDRLPPADTMSASTAVLDKVLARSAILPGANNHPIQEAMQITKGCEIINHSVATMKGSLKAKTMARVMLVGAFFSGLAEGIVISVAMPFVFLHAAAFSDNRKETLKNFVQFSTALSTRCAQLAGRYAELGYGSKEIANEWEQTGLKVGRIANFVGIMGTVVSVCALSGGLVTIPLVVGGALSGVWACVFAGASSDTVIGLGSSRDAVNQRAMKLLLDLHQANAREEKIPKGGNVKAFKDSAIEVAVDLAREFRHTPDKVNDFMNELAEQLLLADRNTRLDLANDIIIDLIQGVSSKLQDVYGKAPPLSVQRNLTEMMSDRLADHNFPKSKIIEYYLSIGAYHAAEKQIDELNASAEEIENIFDVLQQCVVAGADQEAVVAIADRIVGQYQSHETLSISQFLNSKINSHLFQLNQDKSARDKVRQGLKFIDNWQSIALWLKIILRHPQLANDDLKRNLFKWSAKINEAIKQDRIKTLEEREKIKDIKEVFEALNNQ